MSVLCKCEPDRSIADILGKKITKKYPLKHGWSIMRIGRLFGKKWISIWLRTTAVRPLSSPTEDMEEFYDMYGYDLDEQPRHIQNMAMWLNDETPIQMSGRSATLTKGYALQL
jgi:hypothetical protein